MTGSWLTTADHKRIGRMYLVSALGFLVVGGVFGELLRSELSVSGSSYLRLYDLHSTATAVLVLGPLWIGLATYLIPLQIGAARLAFPRLQSFALWSYVLGGLLHLASYTGAGPRIAGIGLSHFTLTGAGDKGHTDLWIASLAVVTVAALLANANLVATVLVHRTEGMTLARIPMFSWATLVSGVAALLAASAFLAGLALLYLDTHFGGTEFFGAGTVGTQVIWQHLLWLYGRPDVYLLLVPGLGAASDIVSAAAKRPLANPDAVRAGIAGVAFLGFGSWAAGTKVAAAVVLPTYSVLTALIAVPLGVVVLVWLDTLRRGGRPSPDAGMVFVVAFILSLGAGALAAVVAGVKSVDGGTTWSTGQVHLVVFVPSLLLAVGVLHHWAPKLFGRALGVPAAAAQAVLLLGGGVVFAVGQYAGAYNGRMAGLNETGSTSLLVARLGGLVLIVGVLAVAGSVGSRLARAGEPVAEDDEGLTLEWATTSPPPPHNFDTIPEVRSSTPLADLREVSA